MEFTLLFFIFLSSCIDGIFCAKPFRLQMVSQTDDGAYDFAYDTGEGTYHIQSRDNQGTVIGKFAYIDPDGKLREIDYTADDNGFRPQGDIHPRRLNRFKSNSNVNVKSETFKPKSVPEIVKDEDPVNTFFNPRLDGLIGQTKSGFDLKTEKLIEPSEVELVVPGQVVGPVSSVTMKSDIVPQIISARPSNSVAPLLSTGSLPIELRNAHPRIRLEANSKSSAIVQESGQLGGSGNSELLEERKITRNAHQISNGNVFPQYLERRVHSNVAPIVEFPAQESLQQELPIVREEFGQPNLITKNQSERLKVLLEKLLTTMSTDGLLETLENIVSSNTNIQKKSPIDGQPKPKTQSEELFQILSTLQDFFQRTNLTQTNLEHQTPNIVKSKFPPEEDEIQEKFPDASIDVIQTPFVGSQLYLPVEGVRNINGEAYLERSYLPFTRRYGYVYTERGE